MTLSSTQLIAELQSHFYTFVTNSTVNKYKVPFPPYIDEIFLRPKSFIHLLFQEDYNHDTYYYHFNLDTNHRGAWPRVIRDRIMVYSQSAQYLVCDTTGMNVFNIKQHDVVLLDALLKYRQDSTAVIIVDSTNVHFVEAIPQSTLYANFNSLNTTLSKLIFLYLDLKINENFENYNDLNPISINTLLESMFEMYVIDEYFNYFTQRGT